MKLWGIQKNLFELFEFTVGGNAKTLAMAIRASAA